MSDLQSHRAGRATLLNGVGTPTYRAVTAAVCAQCAGVITPGALFSRPVQRPPQRALGLTLTKPVCTACQPLRLDDASA